MHPEWLPGDSIHELAALAMLLLTVLIAVLIGVAIWLFQRGEQRDSRARHATRKLLVEKRHTRGIRNALKVTVRQYHSLRARYHALRGEARRRELTPPHVKLDEREPEPARFVVPPPLDLAAPEGEDPRTWADSGVRSEAFPRPQALLPDDTQTRPIDADLLRLTRDPAKK